MRLNVDCVRATLLTIEAIQTPNNSVTNKTLLNNSKMEKFNLDDINYTLQQLTEAKLIKTTTYLDREILIDEITWKGSEFLDQIRQPKIWRKIKSAGVKIGSLTLPTLLSLAFG